MELPLVVDWFDFASSNFIFQIILNIQIDATGGFLTAT